jgi:hypothetical protein
VSAARARVWHESAHDGMRVRIWVIVKQAGGMKVLFEAMRVELDGSVELEASVEFG